MSIRLTLPTSLADYPAIAELHNLARIAPVSREELHKAEMQTPIDRSHRRQHIAMALTLLTIDYAQKHGATKLQVFNDSRNEGMLSMQEKLGYQPIPGRYIMTK